LNEELPGFYKPRKIFAFYFDKWRHEYAAKLEVKRLQRIKLFACLKVSKSFQDRQLRYAILIWHEKLYFK
jgi:hypothetical protein